MTAADLIHMRAQQRLQQTVGRTVNAITRTVTAADRSPAVRASYALATSRTIAGGQRQAANLAVAYMHAYAEPVEPPDVTRALSSTAVTVASPVAVVGLLRLWTLLDDGVDEVDARDEASSMAANLAEGDLQAAQRAGLEEGARAAHARPRWRHVANPDACAWCRSISEEGAVFRTAGAVPFHNSDRCGVAPAFEREE